MQTQIKTDTLALTRISYYVIENTPFCFALLSSVKDPLSFVYLKFKSSYDLIDEYINMNASEISMN